MVTISITLSDLKSFTKVTWFYNDGVISKLQISLNSVGSPL